VIIQIPPFFSNGKSTQVAAFDESFDVDMPTKARQTAAAAARARAADQGAEDLAYAAAYAAEPFYPGPAPHSAELLLLRAFLDASGYGVDHPPASPEEERLGAAASGGGGLPLREAAAILGGSAVHIVPVAALAGFGFGNNSHGSGSAGFGYLVACNQFGRNGAGMQAAVGPRDAGRAEHALLLTYPSHAAYAAALRAAVPAAAMRTGAFAEGAHGAGKTGNAGAAGGAAADPAAVAEFADDSSAIAVAVDAAHDAFFQALLRSPLDRQQEVFRAWGGAATTASAVVAEAALRPLLAPLAARIAVGFLRRCVIEGTAVASTDRNSDLAEALRHADLSLALGHNYFTPDEARALET
jgi:hypothetical protein